MTITKTLDGQNQFFNAIADSTKINYNRVTIEDNQELIYHFFLNRLKIANPESIIIDFQDLFFKYRSDHFEQEDYDKFLASKALFDIIFDNNEQVFINTLKRCCYILINNWEINRQYQAIYDLVKSFSRLKSTEVQEYHKTVNRRKIWLQRFIDGEGYQQLNLYLIKYDQTEPKHWSERFTSYLLVEQYSNADNSQEQREAAQLLAQELKQKFKFELAMYTARCQSQSNLHPQSSPHNPTALGDEVVRLIKILVAKRGQFNYINLARIFLKQTKDLYFSEFKVALYNYIFFGFEYQILNARFRQQFYNKIINFYSDYNDQIIDNNLMLRTCKRVLAEVTTENGQEPSTTFIALTSSDNPLNLVIILLKIVLICPYIRVYLEKLIAILIKYYQNYPESECQWIVNFFEVLNVTLAIYADQDVRYNVVKLTGSENDETLSDRDNWDHYRIFSQSLERGDNRNNQE